MVPKRNFSNTQATLHHLFDILILCFSWYSLHIQDNSSLFTQFLTQRLSQTDIDYFVNYTGELLGEIQTNSSLPDPIVLTKCDNDTSSGQEDRGERVCNLGFAQIKIENFRVSMSIFFNSFQKSLNFRAGNEGARKDGYIQYFVGYKPASANAFDIVLCKSQGRFRGIQGILQIIVQRSGKGH